LPVLVNTHTRVGSSQIDTNDGTLVLGLFISRKDDDCQQQQSNKELSRHFNYHSLMLTRIYNEISDV
jgi:hypothetical protein